MIPLNNEQIFKALNARIVHCSIWPIWESSSECTIELTILEGPLENKLFTLTMTRDQLSKLIQEDRAE